jgi:hypothetical protein
MKWTTIVRSERSRARERLFGPHLYEAVEFWLNRGDAFE